MNERKIPPIIHYCWFGENPKSELILKCIASWKTHMPEYEIHEWNEKNYDVKKVDFVREAYQEKRWAFVSDYARFDIIYQYGGIYFDTDVELLKPIPESILSNNAFTGFESGGSVAPGLVYADIAGGRITKEILNAYNLRHFIENGKIQLTTVNDIITDILKPYGLIQNDSFQLVEGLAIYPSSFFCGFDQDVKEFDIRENTISVHHYVGTWTKRTSKQILRKYFKKIFGVDGYRKILYTYRRIRNIL